MDKLTAIKIKYDDGTYSDEIPVSVLAENVEWDSTHTLVDVLGSIEVDVTGTIQDQISQLFNEKVNSSEVEVLKSRIDNLIKLESGSTTGDAELADIRVGADGAVYPSAGEAVRAQVNALDEAKVNKTDIVQTTGDNEVVVMSQKAVTEEVTALKEDLDDLQSYNIERSINEYQYNENEISLNVYVDTITGKLVEYSKWSTSPFILVEPNTSYQFIYKANNGIWYALTSNYSCEYDSEKNRISNITTKTAFTTSSNAKYVRVSQNVSKGAAAQWKNLMLVTSDVAETYLGTQKDYVPYLYKIVINDLKTRTEVLEEKTEHLNSKIDSVESNNTSSGIAYILRKNEIPSYYIEQPSEPSSFDDMEYLESKIKSVPNGKHFIFITDPHYPANQNHSIPIISYIANRMNINAVLMGGDILDREDTKYKGANALSEYTSEMLSALSGKTYLPVLGNHDVNTANTSGWTDKQLETVTIPYNYVYERMFSSLEGMAIVDDASKMDTIGLTNDALEEVKNYMKLHYYVDDNVNKMRYINLVTGTTNSGIIKKIFGLSNSSELLLQFDWLYDALMSVPSDYDVVLCGHAMITWGATASPESDQVKSYCLKICEMLSALKTKGSCTVNNDKTNAYLTSYYTSGNHDYDFSNANDIGTIVVLGGDTHWDCQCVCHNKSGVYISETISDNMMYQNDSVIAIVTQTDSQGRSIYSGKDYADKPHIMTVGTITEQCFDIVTIGEGVTFTRIGAGNDRHYNYN